MKQGLPRNFKQYGKISDIVLFLLSGLEDVVNKSVRHLETTCNL